MPFVVVGIWANGRGDRVVHRETVKDDTLRQKYDAIKAIRFTDNTVMYIETYPLDEPPQKLAYKALLDAVVRKGLKGTFGVEDV